jgi:hypothetical protein
MTELSREDFLALLGLNSALLDRRVADRQAAFAYGTELSAKHGSYLPLDVLAMGLVDAFAGVLGRELAADFVRLNSDEWFLAIVSAEWEEPGPYYFAALTQLGFAGGKRSCRGLAGTLEEITGYCRHVFPVTTLMAVNIDEMLSEIHARSQNLEVSLPEKLTPQPGTPAYERLRDAVNEHRAQAEARLKAKGRRPKRFPSNLVKPAPAKKQGERA